MQIFDSWASELAPQDFDVFSGPYIRRVVDSVRASHPDLQLILYISGSGGLMERMAGAGVDVISVDHRVDLRDALQRIGPDLAVQVIGVELLTLNSKTLFPNPEVVDLRDALQRIGPDLAVQVSGLIP